MTVSSQQPYHLPALQAALETRGLIPAHANLTLSPYEVVFPRRPSHQRCHYRVEVNGQNLCHLVIGPNLRRVHEQAENFFRACPNLICRPLLFWEQSDGIGHLCLEHFAGEALDDAVLGGRCSAMQWLDNIRQVQLALAATQRDSTPAALEDEIHRLVSDACNFPGFTRVDAMLLRELAGPLLIEGAPVGGISTRWSNGDFIGRNILVNAAGELRLIDYEHAAPTHFWASDWLRLMRFSVLPVPLDRASIGELTHPNPVWQELHLWLQNLSQLDGAEPGDAADRHTTAVIGLLFDSIRRAGSHDPANPSHSFLLNTLIEQRVKRSGRFKLAADQASLHSLLTADLDQANYRVLALQSQLAQQAAALRNEQGIQEQERLNRMALDAEASRLRLELERAQLHLDHLLDKIARAHLAPAANARSLPPAARATGAEILHGIDQAGRIHAADGRLSLSGWIIETTGEPCQVRLRLERGDVFDCQSGISRPDVETAHPNRPGNLASGFALHADVPAGLHFATLEHRTSSFDWTPVRELTLLAGISPLIARLEIAVPPRRPAGSCQISGWCFHPQEAIDSLTVRFGATIAPLQHGLPRPDVAASNPWNCAAGRSGFSGTIQLAGGRGDIVMTAKLRSGALVSAVLAKDILVPDDAVARAIQDLKVPRPEMPQGGNLAYRLNETLHFGPTDAIKPFLESGWSGAEGNFRWAIGAKAVLRLPFVSAQQPRKLRLLVVPLLVPGRVDRQRINLDFPGGGVPVSVELVRDQPQEIEFGLPAGAPEAVLMLQFGFPDACRPQEFEVSEDNRLLSVRFLQLTVC